MCQKLVVGKISRIVDIGRLEHVFVAFGAGKCCQMKFTLFVARFSSGALTEFEQRTLPSSKTRQKGMFSASATLKMVSSSLEPASSCRLLARIVLRELTDDRHTTLVPKAQQSGTSFPQPGMQPGQAEFSVQQTHGQ